MRIRALGLAITLFIAGCASAPPAAPLRAPSFDEKMSWVLRLEQQRILSDPAPAPVSPPPVARGRKAAAAVPPPPPPSLLTLLGDSEARVRRRAALAVGRVGVSAGVEPLFALLGDADPEVRQVAAFALGLIGDERARPALTAALSDRATVVKASAAEALGMLPGRASADAVAAAAADILRSGALAATPGDDADGDRDSPAAVLRLSLFALARMQATDQILGTLLDPSGQPRSRWWPAAYALARTGDARARPALRTLAADAHPYTRAFAIRALAAAKDGEVVKVLLPYIGGSDRFMAFEAVRAIGQIGEKSAAPSLASLIRSTKDAALRADALLAFGSVGGAGSSEMLLDWIADPAPAVRLAALSALAQSDAEQLLTVLAGLDPDSDWSVRAGLADVLSALPPDVGQAKLATMLNDSDTRVVAAALLALARLRAPTAAAAAITRLGSDDIGLRVAAARAVEILRPVDGPSALGAAFALGAADPSPVARLAVLDAAVAFGAQVAMPLLRQGLQDKDWAVRVHAAAQISKLDPSLDPRVEIRPAPLRQPPAFYAQPTLVNPPVSVQAYVDTNLGSIQVELAMLDAPLAVESFMALARAGHFDGVAIMRTVPNQEVQAGDVRGDGAAGPGYTVRDEVAERPVLRGTVAITQRQPESGGDQFFIALSPLPDRDGQTTVIGRVVGGMDVADQLQRGDVVRRVRIWDGQTMK